MSLGTRSCIAAAGLGLAALLWTQAGAQNNRTTPVLGGPDRYLTAVSTDKPIYRPGEKVYVRGVLLHALKRTPLPPNESAEVHIEIKGPKGETVASGSGTSMASVWSFAWPVPAEQAGGEYTLKATYPWAGHAPAERKFDVRAYRAPRLKTQIEFLRDGYGPGDRVTATVDVKRAEGGVPAGAKVTATARVDGVEVARVPAKVDGAGLCTVSFELPREIARGEGSLAFAIEDGGVVETAAKTIPILLQTLDLQLFPEGGDLVAGVPSRVYFEARTPAQKPADIAGVVVDARGATVAQFRSAHEGRGRFEFTPQPGARYMLRVQEPAGIKTTWPLPEVKAKGATVRAEQDVVAPGRPIALSVAGTAGLRVKVTLSHREEVLDTRVVDLGTAPARVELAAKEAEGLLVVTVWDVKDAPLAERLVFRRSAKPLRIELEPDRTSYVPGGEVKLTVRTSVNGDPVPAHVGLTVTDDSVLEMIEKREQAPQLAAMVFLEPEVRELADAHVYLDDTNAKAPLAMDLLLGTQGWRRFALVDAARFIATHGDAARRALALRVPARHEQILHVRSQRANLGLDAVALAGGEFPPEAAIAVEEKSAPDMPMDDGVVDAPASAAPQPVAKDEAEVAGFAMPSQVASEADRKMVAAIEQGERAEKKKRMHLADEDELVANPTVVYVREYAHVARPNRKPNDRSDFTETLYWNASVVTDKTGRATVRFALNDSVTSFRVSAGGFTGRGSIGDATTLIESVRPFYAEAKLPLEVTAGDQIALPISLVNGTQDKLAGATISVSAKGGDLRLGALERFDLRAGDRARRLLDIKVGQASGPISLAIAARAGSFEDTVTRPLAVKPRGFPFELAFGGMLRPGKPEVHTVRIPDGVVPNSVRTNIAVFPTPLANMTEALARLIQDPYGCFEQTSSTSYPLTMAQQYFLGHSGVDPKLVAQAREKLDASYKRLVGFECSQKGYEWFGENPGHEALSAYGLMHFVDMAQVRQVDRAMIDRTREWLMKQRDGKGGFERKRRALHTWVEDKDSSDGYILWALLESGQRTGLEKEVAAFKTAAAKSPNSYVVALGANVAALAEDAATARTLMQKLVAKQQASGAVDGSTGSIVGSEGEALEIETTSLATLAWLRQPEFAGAVEKSIRYLADSCKGGRYGSTQSTVLALRAIVAYDKARARPRAPGSVRVYVDGQAVGSAVPFDRSTQGAIKLPDISELLGRGEHRIELRMQDGGEMPYALAVNYNALTPDSSKACKVGLQVALTSPKVNEGELVEANAVVVNRTRETIPTAVAIIGVPGGLEPRHDQLKELVKKGTIDAYEVIGREVVLYWRGMTANQKIEVPLSLLAAIPGTYSGPASRAYLYYGDEHKDWVEGLKVTIAPKN